MDQDFHYYGTYYAARSGGFTIGEATLIAKASNFIDFFTDGTYAAYWKLVTDTQKSASYQVVASLDYPRYTFQGGFLEPLGAPDDGLWCSFHFTPGNYADPPQTPSREAVHGAEVAALLPAFQIRDTSKGASLLSSYQNDLRFGKMLNRPQSGLARELILDTIACATSDARLEAILGHAIGATEILGRDRAANLQRFRLILLGVRAHVIADTWAHQDFCGLNNVLNTYWDIDYNPSSWNFFQSLGRQYIEYWDGTGGWSRQVLSGAEAKLGRISANFEAAPNGTSYLGHGWMGHLPDFSFAKFRYKPCWDYPSQYVERDNPQQYRYAWLELVSLFNQARGAGTLKISGRLPHDLDAASRAIASPCQLTSGTHGRKSSANAWQSIFGDLPATLIDVEAEPAPNAVLDGMIESTQDLHRYGTDFVNVNSDLYLFQIAADYHFRFVKSYLSHHGIYEFSGHWALQNCALSPAVDALFRGTNPA